MKRVYLDYNATTPTHPEVIDFIRPLLAVLFGNPSSSHWAGREARRHVEEAREQIGKMVRADPGEIVFTSCGSESDNHAVRGAVVARRDRGNHIVTTSVEHPAVLNTCKHLEGMGYEVTYLGVDRTGQIAPEAVDEAIRKETILISIMYANNETGTLFPIREIGGIARDRGVLFHSDMVQALGKIHIDVRTLNVDLASFSGHKAYAPKGVGALFVRQGLELENLIHGGHQEGSRRAGTENVIGMVAFGKACAILGKEMTELNKRLENLRQRLLNGIIEVANATLNGHQTRRLPNTLNISFEQVDAASLLVALDLEGIAAASGAACSTGSIQPSHVLTAMGVPPEMCKGSVRFSLGRESTENDIDYALSVIAETVPKLRKASPDSGSRR
jgi:cysteine desulfurase